MARQILPGYCALCVSRCGCLGTVEDGTLTRVDPDPDHPTGQALCVKARAAPEAVDDPSRLLYPLRRTRPKGDPDPGWARVSWDAALDLLAARIRESQARHGPEGVAFAVATPSGTAVADSFAWIHRLAHACASPNLVFATENCNWHKDYSPALTFGAGIGIPDYPRTGCILLWGFNPSTTWLAQATAIQAARRRGARLIVVDPRRAGLAASADVWLRPRPGTDAALALGMARVLLEEERYDRAFVARWSDAPCLVTEDGRKLSAADLAADGDPGRSVVWDLARGAAVAAPPRPPNDAEGLSPALEGSFTVPTRAGPLACRTVFSLYAERCAAWPARRVEEVAGVPGAQVAAAARMLAEQGPAAFFTWTGTCQQASATQANRAIATLYALTGSLDAPGGNVWFSKPPVADMAGFEWVEAGTRARTLGLAERPLGPGRRGWITTRDLFQAIARADPYPVSCLVSFGGNFLLSKPATRLADEALAQLDFFALAELHETPTARQADLLLPVCTAWEREGLQAGFQVGAAAEAHVQLRPAFVAPRGESRSDTWIVFQLARRLGLADRFFQGDPEAGLAGTLAPAGLSPATLRAERRGITLPLETRYRKYESAGFATPSGRVEFHSGLLAGAGQDPLPAAEMPSPAIEAAYPLVLTTAKWPQYCHSQQRGLPALRRRMPDPLLEMHPEAAFARGLGEGDWAWIATTLGRIRARVRLDAHLDPGVVCAQYGWWQYPDGAGDANRLIDGEAIDPVAGSNSLRRWPCQVSAVG